MCPCWYCHWGWPRKIREIYDRAEEDINEALGDFFEKTGYEYYPDEPSNGEFALEYGPAHVVWCDENFDLAESCLRDCEIILSGKLPEKKKWLSYALNWHQPSLEILTRSLKELAAIPLEDRTPPKGYEKECDHPEKFPPPEYLEVRKKTPSTQGDC